jgi:predicted DNA-binding protein YlxM (UPF0122 family)
MSTIFTVAAIQFLAFFIIYFMLRRWIERRVKPDEVGRKLRDELESIMVELNRTTEQNIELIEDKINRLQELLAEADKKLSVLKREAEKHEISRSIYDQIRSGRAGSKQGEVGDRKIQKEVIKLHKEGFSPGVIAGYLGTTVGEVELIISLQNSKD